MHWNGEPYTVEIFDDRGHLIEVLSRHGTLDEAREAYGAMIKKPRRAGHALATDARERVL
jgi:hypothetical protein